MNKITEEDYQWAASKLKCSVAAIKAVAQVESNGEGFLPSGEPKILFEAHWFSKLTLGRYDASHPHISSPTWNKKLYKGGQAEHLRLQEAVKLDRNAGLGSASWGMFQIMGFNWKLCGVGSLQQFINAMYAGEKEQFRAFVNFIIAKGLAKALGELDWEEFAYRYNGAGYRANKYHIKMANAYKSFLN